MLLVAIKIPSKPVHHLFYIICELIFLLVCLQENMREEFEALEHKLLKLQHAYHGKEDEKQMVTFKVSDIVTSSDSFCHAAADIWYPS